MMMFASPAIAIFILGPSSLVAAMMVAVLIVMSVFSVLDVLLPRL